MASELWQRLRAARKFADMTQAQLAAACGITRSGYAFFEAGDPNSRSRPSAEQVMAISRLTKVPIEWLMNDSVNAGDVWKVGVVANGGVPLPPAPSVVHASNGHPLRRATDKPGRAEETFWRAVEYHVLTARPGHEDCFEVQIGNAALPLRARYMCGQVLACFTSNPSIESLTFHMGRLLLFERAMAKIYRKHLLVWGRDGGGTDLNGTIEAAQDMYGVSIRQVVTAEEAAAYLVSQK